MSKKMGPKSLTSKIFDTLIHEVDDLIFVLGHHRAVFYTLGDVEAARNMLMRRERSLQRENRQRVYQSVLRLKRQKYIKIKQKDEMLYIFLTDDGIQEALKRKIISKKNQCKKSRMCYISFDIPEPARSSRAALRWLLKRANFKMIHLSLWATSRDVSTELATLIKLMKLHKWVHVFIAEPISKIG